MNDNFQQLLQMKAEDDPNLAEWLRRKENVYTSPAIQNEIIKVMGLQVLKRSDLQSSSFLTVMADETTDSSNREQVTLILPRSLKSIVALLSLGASLMPVRLLILLIMASFLTPYWNVGSLYQLFVSRYLGIPCNSYACA